MFHLYHSNDLELLKELLIKQMQSNPSAPFEKEAILVQSQGMAHWLKLQLASGLGIAAQIDFPLPSKFIWQVFNALNPQLPERTHFDKQVMAWKLMHLLPTLATQSECSAIGEYLEWNNGEFEPLKCYQLAQNIADTFDQYLIYRPHWLLDWEQGLNTIDGQPLSVHGWQPYVWRALVESTPIELQGKLPREHRARVQLTLPELVSNNTQAFKKLPKRLFVFGIATLPKVYWQVLQAISTDVDIHFYLLNPCNEFWSDIVTQRQQLQALKTRQTSEIIMEVGNPLLASWGKLGREFLSFVQAENQGLAEFELFYQDTERPPTLLSFLQQDILYLHNRQAAAFTKAALANSEFKQGIAADDGSVRFVSAHSPLREVQRLYDQILYWLDNDSTLKPRDIVVMVPDINQYAPYIDAVFSSHKAQVQGEARDYRIPWAIADQAIAQENPIIESFLSLLALPNSRFLSTEIQDWLEVEAIARRFELTQDDLEIIRDWLGAAEIRWGLDGQQRAELGLPNFNQNSWRQGLRQLLLGAMLPDSALTTGGYQEDFPVFAVEGNESERLGKLMQFIDTLEHFRQRLNQADASVECWQNVLSELLDAFYLAEGYEVNSLQNIRQALQQWQEDVDLAEFTGQLTGVVVAAWFNDHLGQQTGWQRFLAGPVNFCSLMPMRSIPFKAVCLLGMNDNDYPRRTTPMGFDLIHKYPQAGDRSRREDDRYLFLEAVCSAQHYLYVSYRGRDIRENSEQQPSVLVAELRDYLADSFCLQSDVHQTHADSRRAFLQWLEEELPLQPYNQRSFSYESVRAVPSYQQLWAQVAQADEEQTIVPHNWLAGSLLDIPTELNKNELQWHDVIQALSHPPQFFIRRRLQANLETDWQEQEVSEPFGTDKLVEYQLKSQWLKRVQQHPQLLQDVRGDALVFSQQQQALGRLPVNQLGLEWGEKIADTLAPLAQSLLPLLDFPIENSAIQLTLSETTIMGELQQAYQDPTTQQPYLLFYRVGRARGKHLLDIWLRLLLASLNSEQPVLLAKLFTVEKDGIELTTLAAPSAEIAQQQIEQALNWYWQSWREPLPHLPDSLWQAVTGMAKIAANEKLDSDDKRYEAQENLVQTLLDSEYGELNDLYTTRCLAGFIAELPNRKAFARWLQDYATLMACLYQHQSTEKVEA